MLRCPKIAIYLGLALATLAAFWPTLRCGFVNFDDPLYVSANPHVQSGLGWQSFAWAWTAHHASNWHPVTWLSHMLDCRLFGLHPAGHHLVNLLLHLANTLLLFGLLDRLTRALWPGALVAAWFGLHPSHVESVAWVAERKDVLSTLFFLLTLWAYAAYVQSQTTNSPSAKSTLDLRLQTPVPARRAPSSILYLLSLLCYALGLMTKPMLVTLPFVLLLLDYWPLGRFRYTTGKESLRRVWPLIREKLPFFALALLSCGVTLWAQRAGGSVIPVAWFPIPARAANALLSCWRYVGQTFWPADYAVFYPYSGPAPTWLVLGAAVWLAAVTAVVLRARRAPYLAVGWLWFLGTLIPVIGLIQVGTQAMADRYLYIPSIGLLIAAAFGLGDLATRFRVSAFPRVALAAGTVAALFFTTRCQVSYWRDSETLLRHALNVTRGNYVAYNNLGTAFDEAQRADAAIRCYEAALRIKPDMAEARINLGRALMNEGRLTEAEHQYRLAIQDHPASASAYYNLANLLFRQGKTGPATDACRQALALQEEFPAAHNNLGCLLAAQGEPAEAITHFQRSLQLRPDDPETLNNLGSVLTDQGRPHEALPFLTKAVQLRPDYSEAHYNLGNAYAAAKAPREALAQYELTLRLNPAQAWANYKLGNLLLTEGNPGRAMEHYRAALAANTNLAEAHYQLATLLSQRREFEDGARHLREALRLKPNWLEPLNNLAWLLATAPDAKDRNGPEAVQWATRAAELTRHQDAEALDTLAAAYAESGRFHESIDTAQAAISLARAAGQTNLAAQITSRLNRYQAHSPFRE